MRAFFPYFIVFISFFSLCYYVNCSHKLYTLESEIIMVSYAWQLAVGYQPIYMLYILTWDIYITS